MRWLIVGFLLVTGCAASLPRAANMPDAVIESWTPVDVAPLNERIVQGVAAGTTWPTSPLRMTIELFGSDEDMASLALKEQKNSAEVADTTVVILVRDGFLDDSVRGDWHRIVYRRLPDRTWRVHDARRAIRCWRGHTTGTFGSQPCL